MLAALFLIALKKRQGCRMSIALNPLFYLQKTMTLCVDPSSSSMKRTWAMVEEYLEKQQSVSTFQDFLKTRGDRNPLTEAKIIIAKNYDYAHQKSDESTVMLIPLATNDDWINLTAAERDRLSEDGKRMGRNYAYVLPVYNKETKLTEYMFRISRINNLEKSGNQRMYRLDNSKIEKTFFEKEISCVPFLAKYFDPKENQMLYTAEDSSRSYLVPQRKKYDNDSEPGGGYIELRHQRTVVGKNRKVYVHVLCCWQHFTGEDFQLLVTVASVLYGEFRLLFDFLKFTERYYNVSEYERFAFQKRYLQTSRDDVSKSLDRLLKRKKEKENPKKNDNARRRDCPDDAAAFRNMAPMYPDRHGCLHGVSDGYEGDCTCENCGDSTTTSESSEC